MSAEATLPAFARQLCDDAAMFPPGLAPLAEAVPAHRRHEKAAYAEMVGPLIVAAPALRELASLLPAADGDVPLPVAVTVPGGPCDAGPALAAVSDLPVTLRALEVAVPDGMGVAELLEAVDSACGAASAVEVFVEIPRDTRREAMIAALAETRYRAKFRTGGVRAELYPDEAELAGAITAVVAAGLTELIGLDLLPASLALLNGGTA